MLPKSSPRIAEVVKIANEIAREYEREYVGTEHVLLAILRVPSGLGATVLAKRGLTEKKLRSQIDNLIKAQMEETWVFGRLPGTPHFKNVMASAIRQCQEVGAKVLCTEHLLLALAKVRGCVANKALKAVGLPYEAARQDVIELTTAK